MVRILSALVLAVSVCLCQAQTPPIDLLNSAPNQYLVVSGDTLWSLSARFLKEPWRWPELWQMNREQIRNPHRIYPGDVIVLERDSKGIPYLRLDSVKLQPRIYSEPSSVAIPPIPPNVIEPFISAPLVIDAEGLDRSAKIVATQEDRLFLGPGDLAYVENAAPDIAVWQIFRSGRPLFDPGSPKLILGYEALFIGTAKQIRPGSPATFEILTAKQELGRGDRALPAKPPTLIDYIPHKPDFPVDGRVVSIYGGVGSAGVGSIVSVNQGSKNGLEIGHVLALSRNRTLAGRDESDRKFDIHVPPQRVGLIFIFRIFERISYALVLQSEGTVDVNDFVRTP